MVRAHTYAPPAEAKTEPPLRLLVTGDRNWTDEEVIRAALGTVWHRQVILIHGAARGADKMAERVAKTMPHITDIVPYPAQWNRYHHGAGPIRNQQMLDEGKPDMCFAFHDNLRGDGPDITVRASKGTRDMVERCQDAGILVMIWTTK